MATTIVAILVAACGVTPSPSPSVSLRPSPSSTPAPTPIPEQTLTMALDGDISGGLSNAAEGVPTPRAAAFLYNGLYGLDEHLAPVPVLAEGPATLSADGRVWTIRLRDGITFHDGTPLTADDVVQTFSMARSPDCRFDPRLCVGSVLAAVERVDDLTVAFTLTAKVASFATTNLQTWIESKDAIDASYARFLAGVEGVTVTDVTGFLARVGAEESIPTGPAGGDGTPTVDYGQFRADGEGLLQAANVGLPSEAAYTTDGAFDVDLYVRDILARVRAIDASFTSRHIDALAAAYPYLDFQSQPVGTGPFKFDSYVPGDRLEFVANTDYFLGEPNIKRMTLPIIESDQAGGAALASGEIDWKYSLGPSTFEGIKDTPDLQFVEYLESSFLGLFFNLHPDSDGLFLDRNLRQAVSLCFDKPATAETATGGQGGAIYSEIPPVSWAYPPTGIATYPFDPAKATALIEASGWKLGADGIYAKGGRKLATVVAVRSGFPERSRWMELVGEQVRRCGIDLSYKEVSFAQVLRMLDVYPHLNAAATGSSRSFDAYFGGYRVAVDPDPFRLFHSAECSTAERPSTLNYICYQNDEIDGLIETGRAELDQASRAEIYHRYAILQSEDLPVIYAWSDKIREGLRNTIGTTAPGGLRLDTPTWFREVEKLTNLP